MMQRSTCRKGDDRKKVCKTFYFTANINRIHTRLEISSFCSCKISYLSLLIGGINQSEIEGSKLRCAADLMPLISRDKYDILQLQNDDISSLV